MIDKESENRMEKKNEGTNKKEKTKKLWIGLMVTGLLSFMLFCFGPMEIFFGNVTEFDFLFGEFMPYLAGIFVIFIIVMTVLLTVLPDKIWRYGITVIFGIALAGYLQIMFLNKNLDLLGVNPNGYQVAAGQGVTDLLIWLVIIGLIVALAVCREEIWKKAVTYGAAFLLAIQAVAMFSLLITAPEEAYKRPFGDDRLSGEEQYTVSAKDNVIVFVLDYFSSLYLQEMLEKYPDGADALHDFTYYNNADCTYYGTFPSLAHMLTGQEVDTTIPVAEWCRDIWEAPSTGNFYNGLKNQNYKANIYTTDANVLTASNGCSILRDKISNVTNEPREVSVDHPLLVKTLVKMSAYRMAPDFLKQTFYTNVSEYSLIVENLGEGILQTNSDFYAKLKEKRLQADENSNYFIVQHLIGTHEFNTDINGNACEGGNVEDTARGCMTILEEYLNQLRELGVYDNATIIVTADHGGCEKEDLQIIYFAKRPGETHESSPVTNAPVSHCDLLPTVAQAAEMDYSKYGSGRSAFDLSQDEQRERTMWVRGKDEKGKDIYNLYTYTGDILALITQIDEGPSEVKEMYESYF